MDTGNEQPYPGYLANSGGLISLGGSILSDIDMPETLVRLQVALPDSRSHVAKWQCHRNCRAYRRLQGSFKLQIPRSNMDSMRGQQTGLIGEEERHLPAMRFRARADC